MRQLFVVGMVLAMIGFVRGGSDDPVKCKADGLHLCCATCDSTVKSILGKVDGISAVKVDRKAADKVTFEAATDRAANDALTALVNGGFCCEVTAGAKHIMAPKVMVNLKADSITVKDVHVCCNACTKALKAMFKDDAVTVAGSGTQKDVTIAGKNLDGQTVLDTMRKSGFTGTIQAK